jgi:DNA primase
MVECRGQCLPQVFVGDQEYEINFLGSLWNALLLHDNLRVLVMAEQTTRKADEFPLLELPTDDEESTVPATAERDRYAQKLEERLARLEQQERLERNQRLVLQERLARQESLPRPPVVVLSAGLPKQGGSIAKAQGSGRPAATGKGQGPTLVQQQQQTVVVYRSGTNHCLWCVLTVLTGGLALPCWLIACCASGC